MSLSVSEQSTMPMVGTEHDADGRVVAFRPFQFIVHPDVHVHLPDILIG